ncbi:MAG: zf-HC2 domain-containing protein [bacterium]|nr:zf-HC2 domain-containing protein [bacterium]
MMTGSDEITGLREAFAACAPPAVEGSPGGGMGSCPPPERIWEALRGELPPDEVREVVDHTSACASCAQDWRLAHALGKRSEEAAATHLAAVRRARFGSLRPWLAAAAAAVLIVVGVRWSEQWMPRQESAYRGDEQAAIRSLTTEVSRQRCLLIWEGPEGAIYDVVVSTEDPLETISTAKELRTSEHLVPESSLAKFPAATKVLWRVDAVLPDGSRLSSKTFVSPLKADRGAE